MSAIVELTACRLAREIRSRRISPTEVVEAYVSRIERLNPLLNAFVSWDPERLRRSAIEMEASLRSGDAGGPLCGVPLSVKSSVDVAGYRCEAGSRLRAGFIPDVDAPLVTRLKRAGALILGTTNVPEFLMAWETDNLLYGRTNNPWSLDRTPGGSSGGEAAAIAARCSAGGVGSDGGGSIRVPAHYSGICGLKPTPGRIPATGHFPASAGPFAMLGVVGPMARNVADLKLLFEIMAGPDDGDACAAPVPLRSYAEFGKCRVGVLEEEPGVPVTSETREAVRRAADALQRSGYEVVPFRPSGLDAVWSLWWALFGPGIRYLLDPVLEGHDADLSPVLRSFRAQVAENPPLTLDQLMSTLIERDNVRRTFLSLMQDVPVLLTPVASTPAFRHGEREWIVNGSTVTYPRAMSYCQWFNLLGNPGVVVPAGKSPEGLPIGVQVVGRPWEEERILELAQAIEDQIGVSELPDEIRVPK